MALKYSFHVNLTSPKSHHSFDYMYLTKLFLQWYHNLNISKVASKMSGLNFIPALKPKKSM